MKRNYPAKHRRRSIRLRGYDYSSAGFYFITLCAQNRERLFGHIASLAPDQQCIRVMILNDAGRMIARWYYELENKFPEIKCHEMIVMPDHFHCIIEITFGAAVGADRCVCPKKDSNKNIGADTQVCPDKAASILPRAIQWFKTMTTNEYIRGVKQLDWKPFNKRLWQRNYYEHIIRNEHSLENIANYILNNPANWDWR